MACPQRPVSLTVSLVCFLALFGSYCQMAPAVAGATRGWDVGGGLKYKLTSTVLFREAGPSLKSIGDVGFQLTGELDVTAAWRDPSDGDAILLRIEIISPQLWIKSRKAPEPEGFVEHSSKASEVASKPVLVLWRNGQIRGIYLDPSESVSSSNLKRGLASLFQYRTLDEDIRERDASGLCKVSYASLGPKTMSKRKTFCEQSTFPWKRQHSNPIFAVTLTSSRNSTYELSQTHLPMTVHDEERHSMTLAARPEAGTIVVSERTLEYVPGALSGKKIEADSLKDAIALLQPEFRESSIELQLEPNACPDSGCITLEQAIEECKDSLLDSALGTAKSASAFLKLLPLVKDASSDELFKILKSPRYRQLRSQLLDIYGSASTPAAHQAAMKNLRQDEVGDDTERYLWALSLSPSPNADVAKDVLKRSEETMQNDKVSETMALTAAAMARHEGTSEVIEKARVSLELGLESCTGEACKLKFLRALRNLRSKAATPTLLEHALGENKAISVAAWRALAALPCKHVSPEIRSAARRVFFQIGGPKRDSSSRTIALNVILECNPSADDLSDFVDYLAASDPAYEVRKYLSQRLEQLSQKCPTFARNLNDAFMIHAKKVFNYNVLAYKGLSTAFTRNFLTSIGSSGDLVTLQEVNFGILKRGVVDVVLRANDHEQAMFSLGLFTGGLGVILPSLGPDDDSETDDEPATAGMEIDLLGVGVRPFVFFSGQGDLMGHVWSKTASTRTPAFQALANLHSHVEYVPLAAGIVAEIDVQGAVSFDLAGQVQLSLWSRNAQSLVDMAAGVAIQGGTKVRTNFVQSMADFSLTMEPKLEFATDVDFAGPVALCMRLAQPHTIVRHQIYKIERIPGSRHRLRKTRRIRLHSPGRSYLLNKKNNEMCSNVFS